MFHNRREVFDAYGSRVAETRTLRSQDPLTPGHALTLRQCALSLATACRAPGAPGGGLDPGDPKITQVFSDIVPRKLYPVQGEHRQLEAS